MTAVLGEGDANMVLIPSYQPNGKLSALVAVLQAEGLGDILIVDDGSGAQYAQIFEACRACGCTVLTHPENRGKGAALRTGITYLRDADFSGSVVCADSDGQHLPADIRRCLERSVAEPDKYIFGSRLFTGHVPLRSRFGNTVSRLLYRAATGLALHDTQTGLRAFSDRLFSYLLATPGDRFEFETNAILNARQAGVSIEEIPIETVYEPAGQQHHSHFRTVKDSILVMGPVLRFIAASLSSTVVDYGLSFLLLRLFTQLGQPYTRALLFSTLAARIASSIVNFLVNKKLTFHKDGDVARAALRYALLAAFVWAAGYCGIRGLAALGLTTFLAKIITDNLLFLIGYPIQRDYVFKS